jgi:hypothetical protein
MNMESGSENLILYSTSDMLSQYPTPVYVKNDNFHTSVENMYLINPDNDATQNTVNTDLYKLFIKYGCQFVPYCFYYNDNNLAYYEKVFDENKTAFIPMHSLVTYYSNQL